MKLVGNHIHFPRDPLFTCWNKLGGKMQNRNGMLTSGLRLLDQTVSMCIFPFN